MENNKDDLLLKELSEFRDKYQANIKKIDEAVAITKEKYSEQIMNLYQKFLKYPYTLFISNVNKDEVRMLMDPHLVPYIPDLKTKRNEYLSEGAIDLEFTLALIEEDSELADRKYNALLASSRRNKYIKGKIPFEGNAADESRAYKTFRVSKFFRMLPDEASTTTIGYMHFDIIPFDDYDSMQLFLETREKDENK